MHTKKPSRARNPLILTGVTAILSFLLLLYLHSASRNALEKFVPWVDASAQIKLEVTLAYLWFEEILSDNSDKSIDVVRAHLKQAKWYATAILEGGKNDQRTFLPLPKNELRIQVNQVLYMTQQFHQAAEERYLASQQARSDSESDQTINLLFHSFISAATLLEDSLKKQIAQEHKAQNALILMLSLVISAMVIISSYSIWKFTTSRNRYLTRLATANTRISEQNRQFKKLAHTDQLTRLPNRKMIESMTVQALSRSQRSSGVLSLTFIDLDFFKPINDKFGHNVGDKVLVGFTQAVNAQLRDGDVLARLAGDEFILLIQDESVEKLRQTLESIFIRIKNRLQQPVIDSPIAMYIGFSSGTAIAPQDATDFETLLHHADLAMYESKNKGRGRHTYYRTGEQANRRTGEQAENIQKNDSFKP